MGASLLAMTVSDPASSLADGPPSRASSLPQGKGPALITVARFDSLRHHGGNFLWGNARRGRYGSQPRPT
ncbi:hypothetical protein F7R20_01700 [Pseudomonas brassicacearum subsp. brassicacearum]|nr:hypothetical protein F7R20_01700 [Pseudomonas brassicacearum subsp. brassicacearum]PJH87228.1 hypothetical protein CVG87_20750 [Pseudomonas sp. WCS365]QEO78220.1 hypothetical protein ELZ14_11865 [Pseudomonas brassicacearum]